MKRTILFLCVLGMSAMIWAGPGLRLENDTEYLVYYAAVPWATLADTTNWSQERLAVLLERYSVDLAYLPPKAVLPGFEPGTSSNGLLLLSLEGGLIVPRVIRLPLSTSIKAGSDNYLSFASAKYFTDSNGFQMAVNAGELSLAAGKVRIDGRFGEWVNISESLSSRNAKALSIQRSDVNGPKTIVAANAMTANKGGTDLEFLKQDAAKSEWYIMIASRSALSQGTSLVLRVYAPGAKESSIFFEVPVLESGGPVLLWKGDSKDPRHCGDFAHNGLFLEARIYRKDIPSEISDILKAKGSRLGIHMVYSDGSFSEDWFYGMVEDVKSVFTKGL